MSIFNPVAGLKKVCLLDCSLVGPIVGLKIGQAGQATEKAQVWRMRLWQTCQGDWGYDPGMVSCRPSSRERITKKHTMMDTWNRLYTFKHNQKGSIYGILQRPWCVEDLGEEFFCPDALVFGGIWICDQVWMWSKWKILGPREISRSRWMASWSIQRSTKDWVKNNSFMGSGFSLNSDRFSGNRLRLRITLPDVEMILPNLGAESQWLSAEKELFLPKDKDSWRQRPRIGRTKLDELVFFEFPKMSSTFLCYKRGGATGMIFCTYEMMTLRKWRPKLPLWCKHWVIQPNLPREILKPVLRTPSEKGGSSAPFCRSGQYAPLLALSDWKAKRLSYRNLPTTSPHL